MNWSKGDLLKAQPKTLRTGVSAKRDILRANSTRQQLRIGSNVEKTLKSLTECLEEMEKIERFNDYIDAIILATSQHDGIITGARKIRECKENELWNPDDIICKMLEENIEANDEKAKRAEKIKMISNKYRDLQEGIEPSANKKRERISQTTVHITIEDMQKLLEQIKRGLPIIIPKTEGYIEFAKNTSLNDAYGFSPEARLVSNIGGTLKQKLY